MRFVLYRELAELFSKVDWVMSFRELAGSDLYRWQEGQLSELMSFNGEVSLKQKPELYLQLSERFAADMCYRYFHRVLDEKNSLHVNTHLALAVFASALHERSLKPGRLRRFLGKNKANGLNRRAREINDMQTAIRDRMNSSNEPSNEGE